ncbi:alpha-ketoacid dehydrogenase subunit beta [Sphingomonas flavalba]|uniref:alpha-ketoacid dehydrogenase subunit beta n=1 Tax=Sphingomonas flavalba TaxID=2559804 RepID=UPI0039DFD9E2
MSDAPADRDAGGTGKLRRLTIAKAMNEAIAQEMRRDESVFVMGEDLGALGGIWASTQGLLDEFGAERVRDTPISETAFIGAAVGASAVGMRPIVELMFVDFFGVCFDAIYNLAAKQAYFSGGNVSCPMVLMTSVGGGYSDAGQHSQCLYASFAHMPGLKIVSPSNAYDAKGLMVAAIRDPNPVVFMGHKALQGMGWLGTAKGSLADVPDTLYTVPIGKAAVVREGGDITLIGWASTVHTALAAADALAKQGVSAEVVDVRTLAPLDMETVLKSVRKTGRVIVVDEDYATCGLASEIVARIARESFSDLRSAPGMVTYGDVPPPFARNLEQALIPSVDTVVEMAARQVAP